MLRPQAERATFAGVALGLQSPPGAPFPLACDHSGRRGSGESPLFPIGRGFSPGMHGGCTARRGPSRPRRHSVAWETPKSRAASFFRTTLSTAPPVETREALSLYVVPSVIPDPPGKEPHNRGVSGAPSRRSRGFERESHAERFRHAQHGFKLGVPLGRKRAI